MGMTEKQLREMASQVAATMGKGKPKPRLSVVHNESDEVADGLNALQRDVYYGRISDLAFQYGLGWLVRQDTMHVMGVLECLTDAELAGLLQRLDIAVECIHDGVPFVERGLVKGAVCTWVA